MASTYTPKLNLAKPAHGDVDWHIPVNENWDKIDTELDKALKISGTTIDADKDWGGKNITNVGTLTAKSLVLTEPGFIIVPIRTTDANYLLKSSDAEVSGSDTDAWVLLKSLPPLPANVVSASVYVSYYHGTNGNNITKTRIYVNGEPVGTVHEATSSWHTYGEVISGLKAGDVIQIYGQRDPSLKQRPHVKNLRVYGTGIKSIPIPSGFW